MPARFISTALFTAILSTALCMPVVAQEAKPAPKEAPAKAPSKAAPAEAGDPDEVRAPSLKPKSPKPASKKKARKQLPGPQVNLNAASKEELKKLPGITDDMAARIISIRPLKSKADLVTRGAIPEGVFMSLKDKVAAGDPPKK